MRLNRAGPEPVGRYRTRYVTAGPVGGPGVLLVHGIGVSGRYFDPLTRILAVTHRVVTPDLPGFGDSGRPRPALSIAQQAIALERLLEKTVPHCPLLVGHSMGAQVVTELAVRNPGLASAVVLIGPVTDPAACSAARQAWRLARDTALEPWWINARVLRDYLRGGPRSFAGSLGHMLNYPLERRLAAVTEPVLLVRGSRDPVCPREFLHRLGDGAAGARVTEIPATAHVAMADRPDLVAEALRLITQK